MIQINLIKSELFKYQEKELLSSSKVRRLEQETRGQVMLLKPDLLLPLVQIELFQRVNLPCFVRHVLRLAAAFDIERYPQIVVDCLVLPEAVKKGNFKKRTQKDVKINVM